MKKELFAAALLLLILALSLLNTGVIGGLCDEITGLVERSAGAAEQGDWEESQAFLEEAMALWKEREVYTGIVLRHTDIETLTDDFYELTEHIYTHDGPAASAASALVREHLASIRKMEGMNLSSIF